MQIGHLEGFLLTCKHCGNQQGTHFHLDTSGLFKILTITCKHCNNEFTINFGKKVKDQ